MHLRPTGVPRGPQRPADRAGGAWVAVQPERAARAVALVVGEHPYAAMRPDPSEEPTDEARPVPAPHRPLAEHERLAGVPRVGVEAIEPAEVRKARVEVRADPVD